MLSVGRDQKSFAQPEPRLEMMRDGLLSYLLPGDENTEGLEGISLRVASGEGEQLLGAADVVTDGNNPHDVVENAPAAEDDYFLVPKVIE